MSEGSFRMQQNLKSKRILLAHSNSGSHLKLWHKRREDCARSLGYDISTFCMTDWYPYTIFPYLDRRWRQRDSRLMKLYDLLGERIANSDIFIHYNGALIHPQFLEQFPQIKVYHCADDPDATRVISRPVAHAYDIHAISNPSSIDMYRSWGCNNVFFWPLGAFHYNEDSERDTVVDENMNRDVSISYVGSKLGTPRYRFIHRIPFIGKSSLVYKKKGFFSRLELSFPFIDAYGSGWQKGFIDDANVSDLYLRSLIGVNVHNSLGPINARLYDLAAFGVCQICDNKNFLHHVFELDKEIIGFSSFEECKSQIEYMLANPEHAKSIGLAARRRFLQSYTMSAIWEKFFINLSRHISLINKNDE